MLLLSWHSLIKSEKNISLTQKALLSEWWFWNNQKEKKHFFEDVNSIY